MAGRLSIDFGTSNTVVALWDAEKEEGRTTALAGFSMPDEYDGRQFHVIPSLIHYDGNRVNVGRQVIDRDLCAAPATFNLMKHFIGSRMK
ncbi:Hsp70 family protein, partial [bacterium]|nr:Hsp70 family protein [bacterium]